MVEWCCSEHKMHQWLVSRNPVSSDNQGSSYSHGSALIHPGGRLGSHWELRSQKQTEIGESCWIPWPSNERRKSKRAVNSMGQSSGRMELTTQRSDIRVGAFLVDSIELILWGRQHQLHVLQVLCGPCIRKPTAPYNDARIHSSKGHHIWINKYINI